MKAGECGQAGAGRWVQVGKHGGVSIGSEQHSDQNIILSDPLASGEIYICMYIFMILHDLFNNLLQFLKKSG